VPSLAANSNYTLTSVANGTLYVNPKGTGAKAITVEDECITKLTADPSGFGYKLTWEYNNYNSTSVYIPGGANNKFTAKTTGGRFSGTPPTEFKPGTNFFEIYFDGTNLEWAVTSYTGSSLVTNKDVASTLTRKCNGVYSQVSPVGNLGFVDQTAPMGEVKVLSVYPNPVTSRVMIQSPLAGLTDKDIAVFDVQGKSYPVRGMRTVSAHQTELDMTGLHPGTYLLRVRQQDGYRMLRIIKQ
jgi:hypothetical protein